MKKKFPMSALDPFHPDFNPDPDLYFVDNFSPKIYSFFER